MSALGLWPIYRLSSQPRTKSKQFVDRHRIEKLKDGECGFIDNHHFCLADNDVDGCLWFNPSGTAAVYEEPCAEADVFLKGNTLMARTTLVWKRGDEFWFQLPKELEEFYWERKPFVKSDRRLHEDKALRVDRKQGEYHVASVRCELSPEHDSASRSQAKLE